MSKTAKLKKGTKSTSVRSRESRRAASPSINLDKSLKNIKPPAEAKNVLNSVHYGSGITKRKGRGKAMTRGQRMRQEKGLQRAEAVMDQMEKKVEKGTKKAMATKERANAWDNINKEVAIEKRKAPVELAEPAEDEEWEDVDDRISESGLNMAVTALKPEAVSFANEVASDADEDLVL